MQEPTMNNKHPEVFRVVHLNHRLVVAVHTTTSIISPYQCDATAVLEIEIQRSNKLNPHDFQHEVLNLWNIKLLQ